MQHGRPCLWVEVNPDYTAGELTIRIHGTGQPFEQDGSRYIGMFMMEEGNLVFHVYG